MTTELQNYKLQTHRDNGGSGTGVLGHPAARLCEPPGTQIPVPERPVVPVCKINGCNISRFALELFFILKKDAVNIRRDGSCKFFERCS